MTSLRTSAWEATIPEVEKNIWRTKLSSLVGRGDPMVSVVDREVWVRALAGDIVLCSWARHFRLTAPLSTQVCR